MNLKLQSGEALSSSTGWLATTVMVNLLLHTLYVGSGYFGRVPQRYVVSLLSGLVIYGVMALLVGALLAYLRKMSFTGFKARFIRYNLYLQMVYVIIHVYQSIVVLI